ncbi:hypothetical protein N9D77_03215 [Paracoccaceae bacterium]|nr:hypothetical protein [Paracoccaceae bacterium]
MGIEKEKIILVTGAAGLIGYHISKRLFYEDKKGQLVNEKSGEEIQLADAINKHAQQGSVESVRLNG